MPVWYILIGNSRSHIEHNDGTVSINAKRKVDMSDDVAHKTIGLLIAITKTTKFFLSSRIPGIEADRAKIGVEKQGMDFNSQSGCL